MEVEETRCPPPAPRGPRGWGRGWGGAGGRWGRATPWGGRMGAQSQGGGAAAGGQRLQAVIMPAHYTI